MKIRQSGHWMQALDHTMASCTVWHCTMRCSSILTWHLLLRASPYPGLQSGTIYLPRAGLWRYIHEFLKWLHCHGYFCKHTIMFKYGTAVDGCLHHDSGGTHVTLYNGNVLRSRSIVQSGIYFVQDCTLIYCPHACGLVSLGTGWGEIPKAHFRTSCMRWWLCRLPPRPTPHSQATTRLRPELRARTCAWNEETLRDSMSDVVVPLRFGFCSLLVRARSYWQSIRFWDKFV